MGEAPSNTRFPEEAGGLGQPERRSEARWREEGRSLTDFHLLCNDLILENC